MRPDCDERTKDGHVRSASTQNGATVEGLYRPRRGGTWARHTTRADAICIGPLAFDILMSFLRMGRV